MAKVTLFPQACKGMEDCGICALVCPQHLFTSSGEMNEAGYVPTRLTEPEECTGCQSCMLSCPDMAIVVVKEKGEEAS
ncbi:MAG: 4Fe-4S dicluster domain-containing protein [Desulfarculus sp.]|jgi:2-oxoglutarate ferredoxin oxidoreductase subunit delta|nr:MAG: 4Fe-4S dicluster domain-containing protein [Desulfarculus sp.]